MSQLIGGLSCEFLVLVGFIHASLCIISVFLNAKNAFDLFLTYRKELNDKKIKVEIAVKQKQNKLHTIPFILSRTIWTVVYVGPHVRFIRITYLFIKDHLWSW